MSIGKVKNKFILATDLDGTFLEGDHQTKSYFYNELVRLREQVLLIYTTGRTISVVEQMCKRGYLPSPHFAMGDLGSHIVEGTDFSPIEDLQNPIIEKWNDSTSRLKNILQNESGLQLQPIDPLYRVAYYYNPELLQNQTLQKITDAGFDFIQSSDMYLDIVPRGVNKGSSLLNLLDYLKCDHADVVTAGDSLNDLSLFKTGLKGIVVGNAEPKLLAETKDLDNVYHSAQPGILGIIEGLQFFGKLHLEAVH